MKAYDFFINCKDNHKAWQSFEIFLHGTVLELFHLFQMETNQTKDKLNVLDFLKWQNDHKSATVKLILQLVLTYGVRIYVQRIGERNNDIVVADAGRYSFLDLFYGFNHPIYREIEYRDLRNKAIYPENVSNQRKQNLTFSSKHKKRWLLKGKLKMTHGSEFRDRWINLTKFIKM